MLGQQTQQAAMGRTLGSPVLEWRGGCGLQVAARHAGLDQGALRVGFAAYSTVEDVDRLVDALASITHH